MWITEKRIDWIETKKKKKKTSTHLTLLYQVCRPNVQVFTSIYCHGSAVHAAGSSSTSSVEHSRSCYQGLLCLFDEGSPQGWTRQDATGRNRMRITALKETSLNICDQEPFHIDNRLHRKNFSGLFH